MNFRRRALQMRFESPLNAGRWKQKRMQRRFLICPWRGLADLGVHGSNVGTSGVDPLRSFDLPDSGYSKQGKQTFTVISVAGRQSAISFYWMASQTFSCISLVSMDDCESQPTRH